jgi:dolichol-phosphate mannosyltransferase
VLRLLAALVLLRRLSTGRHREPPLAPGAPPLAETVSVVVPARDEERRIGGVLAPLRDEPGVLEVLVVDDESSDGTASVAASYGARVLRGRPAPPGWAGKTWALQQGVEAARGDWVVSLDADTRPRRGLVAALVARAARFDLLSVGPRFVCEGFGERLLHPSLLATIPYRVGAGDAVGANPPVHRTIANGQCVAVRREPFLRVGGWGRVRGYMTEDVALARSLRRAGWRVGFADAADLLEVRMYESLRETWDGWGRSIIDPAVSSPPRLAVDLVVVWATLAAPQLRLVTGRADRLDAVLLAVRLGILSAQARAYRPRGVAFWLSPLADVATAIRLTLSVLRPSREWRGRVYAGGRTGRR